VARLDSADAIATELMALMAALKEARAELPNPVAVQSASRKGRAESLVQLLNQVTHQGLIQPGLFARNLEAK
jgi:pyridoxine/pyridoxamine 5'-phosphate oxidase